MINKVSTKEELEILSLEHWESLRRRPDFIKDDQELRNSFDPALADPASFDPDSFNLGLEAQKCKTYNMPYWVGHNITIEQLLEPWQGETKIQARYRSEYFLKCIAEPKLNESDDAVFHNYYLFDPLVDGKYLTIYADLSRPRNVVEQELKKIVDQFWSKERHQAILDVHKLKEQPRKKEQRQKYILAYQIYDYHTDNKKSLPFEKIARKVKRTPRTVKRLFLWIANIIHPDGILQNDLPCHNCIDKICEKTGGRCNKIEKILSEGDVKSRGVLPPVRIEGSEGEDHADPFTLVTDHNEYKNFEIGRIREHSWEDMILAEIDDDKLNEDSEK